MSAVNGATRNRTTDTMPMTRTASVRIVWPKRWAAASPSSRLRPTKIGMNGAARPLATITLNRQLRDEERGLERVELVADPERLAQDPLPDEAQEVAD